MRVPNWPLGTRKLRLLVPTKSCAMETMVWLSDCSPWWYNTVSEMYPDSCTTLISFVRLRRRHPYSTLRCEGFSPSIIDGMDRTQSCRENSTSSLFTKSLMLTGGVATPHAFAQRPQ